MGGEDRRRSEAGDTLVEILISLAVIGIAATAIMLAFATTISSSGVHRNLVTMDTMLRTASAEVSAAISQQPASTFAGCSGAYQINQGVQPYTVNAGTIPLPSAEYAATISEVSYWNTTNNQPSPAVAPTATCPTGVTGGGPQLLTVSVQYKPAGGGTPPPSTITSVVDNPNSATAASTCGTPAQLLWVEQPGNGNAGTALFPQPTLVIEDASNCIEKLDASSVKLSVASGPGALKNCVPSLGQGETTFQDCTLSAPGQYTLIANDTDGAVHLTSQASNPFTITQGFPVKLVFATSPGNGTGGLPFSTQPIVDIEDSSNNVVYGDDSTVTLAIATNPGGGTLSTCSVPAVNGIATFTSCSIDKIGNGYTLTANDGADGLPTSPPSLPFNITAGPAAQLAFTTSPATTVVGDPLSPNPAVAVEDAGGNLTTTNMGTVSLGIGVGPAGSAVSGCSQTTSGATVTFSGCSINEVGTYTLKATDGSLTPAFSNPFNVAAAALTSFKVVPSTYTPTAGTPLTVTITALDQSGFTYPNFTGSQTIAFSGPSSSPNGTAPIYPATVTFANGVATGNNAANITLFDAQTTQLTATYTNTQGTQGSVSGISNNITVNPLTAKTLTVYGFPNPTAIGAPGSVTVTADDTYGNVATGYRGTVKFSSTDTKAVLPANTGFTAAYAGTHAFTNGVTLNTAGTQSITATDTATSTITGTEGGITVNKASPSISTTLSASSITVGGTAHDTSALSGAATSTGAGTVVYSYYTNNTCTTGQVAVNTVTVPTSGIVPNSNAATFNSVGTFYWQAVYSGDTNNNGASSPCTATNNEQLTVNKASPTISTALSASSISVGGTANDTSALSGAGPSTGAGTVTYGYYTNNTCTTGQVGVNMVDRRRPTEPCPTRARSPSTRLAPTTGRRSTAATPTTTRPRARARRRTTSSSR